MTQSAVNFVMVSDELSHGGLLALTRVCRGSMRFFQIQNHGRECDRFSLGHISRGLPCDLSQDELPVRDTPGDPTLLLSLFLIGKRCPDDDISLFL